MRKYWAFDTKLGPFWAEQDGEFLTRLEYGGSVPPPGAAELGATPVLKEAEKQLKEYLDGGRKAFDLPLNPAGTEFQRTVRAALRSIPYGETRSYGEVAAMIGRPQAARAVGSANHNNPLLILTPCHRVIGKDGGLTGFGAGLPMKQALLELEKANG